MQDHCNGHRCHGDRFSLYEKCSHRQDLHCNRFPRDTIRLQASMARRDTVAFLSVHEIQRQHKQQHVYRVKGVAGNWNGLLWQPCRPRYSQMGTSASSASPC